MSERPREAEEEGGRKTCFEHVSDWFKYKDKGEWLNEMKGGLSMTASIIATMAFQLATNPPGGVVQTSFGDKGFKTCNTTTHMHACPGISVLAIQYPDAYRQFLKWNAISFVASTSVCLMLVSGIPLNHRFPTWLLSIGMSVAITAFVITYTQATSMVTPNSVWDTFDNLYQIGLAIWLSLLGVVALFLIIRLFVWGVTKLHRRSK